MSTPALLSATLFTSALSLSLLRGKSSNPDVIYHLGEIIRLINKALRDPMCMHANIPRLLASHSLRYVIPYLYNSLKSMIDGLHF
jgi:hypothetical protein